MGGKERERTKKLEKAKWMTQLSQPTEEKKISFTSIR